MKIAAAVIVLLALTGCANAPESVPAPAQHAALHEDADYCAAVADWLRSPDVMRMKTARAAGHEAAFLRAGRAWLRQSGAVAASLPETAPEPVRQALGTLAGAGSGDSHSMKIQGRGDLRRIYTYTKRYCYGG